MDKKTKKAIAKNRVKILGLDYFDLTGPLLASEAFTTKKHKEIKTEASTNKARIDLLLEWIDEVAPPEAFLPFLQGIRNCQENMLAKRIKKEAIDGIEAPKKAPVAPKPNLPPVSFLPFEFPGDPIPLLGDNKLKTKSPKPKITKKPGDVKPEVSGLGTLTLPFNGLGLGALLPPPVGTPTPPSRKRKSGVDTPKLKTPANPNGTPKSNDDIKVVSKSAPTPKAKADPKKSQPVKVKIPKPPRVTRKSSTDKADEPGKKPATKATKKPKPAEAGSSTAPGPSKVIGKAKSMSFKEVETKQQDSRQKFRFKNLNAVVKVIHFKDKTDCTFLGCPYEDGIKICEKRVELKNKEFVCDSRHKSPNCKQIPRLYVTCNDGTADLQLTLFKKTVEVFCGLNASDLGIKSISEIKEALDKTLGNKYEFEVHCEKAKKAAKKSGVPKWNNIANLVGVDDDEGSPAKKKRKN